ncbi:MAG: alpha/beta fold hydrolase [bacterium]|nr:alpha/beta fold hydrolase [bacterium]
MKKTFLFAAIALCVLPSLVLAQDEQTEPTLSPTESYGELFARDTFRLDTMVCPFKGQIEYEPGDIQCYLLQVPENREKPDSRFIELHVVKLNSTWDDEDIEEDKDEDETLYDLEPGKRDDPVVYLTGGPGSEVTYYINRFKDHGIRKHRDMYILEQRGIGYSDDFCPYYNTRKPEVGNVATFEEHLTAQFTAAVDCATTAAAHGVDLSGYNTFENARDVKALRIALGFDKWNVWGISYGSILGQAYIKTDPDGILAVVLDAIVPLDIRNNTWAWRSVQWYDRDLKKLDELCQSQPDCAENYPNLGERIREATLSVKDNPIVVDVKDVENYPTGKAYVFTDIVAFLPFAFMYEQSNYPGLPGLIYAWADAVERRDEDMFKAIAGVAGSFGGGSQGMSNAILCGDADAEVQAIAGQADIEELPILGGAIGTVESYQRRAELCLEHNMVPRDAAEYLPVETDLPALLIEGDMDPITPPPLAKAILPGFANGTYVEFPYAGHGPSRSVECAGDMLNAFYDNPTVEPDLACVEEMEVPEIYAPLFTTSIGPRLMVKALEDKKKLAGPGIWAVTSILIPVIGFLVLTIAPIGRRIDKRRSTPAGLARVMTWFAAFLAVLSITIIGSAFGVTYKSAEILLLFGLVPWAKWGAITGLLAGIVGASAVISTVRNHLRNKLPIGTLLGFLLTGLAAVSLCVFLIVWGLGPF